MWFLGWKGESGFSASSTAEQVTHGIHGTSLTAIITGTIFFFFFCFLFQFLFLVPQNLGLMNL
jgi:hypothetical protein